MSEDFAKSKQGARRRQFKTAIDKNDSRRKREEEASKIRKNKRIESFSKRRNVHEDSENETQVMLSPSLQELIPLSQAVKSGDITLQYEATIKFRKILSIANNPPIQAVIDVGVLPYFVNFLKVHNHPQLQFEAAWALTNIASGNADQTQLVIESDTVPLLCELILSPVDDVREQAIWAIGNIAGDSPSCRDFVLSHGVLDPLIKAMNTSRMIILRNATWALSNLCRGKPQPEWEIIEPALPVLCKLLYSSDEDVLTDATWALSYLSDGPNERIQAVLETGICKRVCELLQHHSFAVQTPALRTIGNIVTGDDAQTQHALNCQLVPCLLGLLSSSKKSIRKEACWTVSNITAGSRSQIQTVLDAHVFPKLITLIKGSDFDVKKEAAWALCNATYGGSATQISYLVDLGIIEQLCELLASSDTRMILVSLEGLDNVLKQGESKSKAGVTNAYVQRVEACAGLDKLESLQSHVNVDIYNRVVALLETYFGAEEDQNIAPNHTSNSFQFQFNGSSSFAF
jgi:importin subunit alpha-1